jgi:hypothetical protein
LDELIQKRPRLHAHYHGGGVIAADVYNWAIGNDVLRWLFDQLSAGWRTLETGCGYTTIIFALAQTEHTVISPFSEEHDAIKNWCLEREIEIGRCKFVKAESQDVIHSLTNSPLDLVLIDGKHAFPIPFIDWYYTADCIKKDGFVLIDDTQLITGRILHEFLSKEQGRWVPELNFGNTSIFRKVTEKSVVKGIWWGLQPYCRLTNSRKSINLLQRSFYKLMHRNKNRLIKSRLKKF